LKYEKKLKAKYIYKRKLETRAVHTIVALFNALLFIFIDFLT